MNLPAAILLVLASQTQNPAIPDWPTQPLDLQGAHPAGQKIPLPDPDAKAIVLLFLAPDCPIANRYAPELARIAAHYQPLSVQFIRVYMLPLDMAQAAIDHGQDFNLPFPALLDPDRRLVRSTGVRVTPEAAVLSPNRHLLYRGRIDARNVEHGRVRPAYRQDLRLALDEILAGKPVSLRETSAIGCFIPSID